MASDNNWRAYVWDPLSIILYSLIVFIPLRQCLKGSSHNYLPSASWFGLCFVIPIFVLCGMVTRSFCVPMKLDLPTGFHLLMTLLYVQMDMWVAKRFFVGGKEDDGGVEEFWKWTVWALLMEKLRPCPPSPGEGSITENGDGDTANDIGDGLTPPSIPPLIRTLFESNGALLHEIFWNVYICQNFLTTYGLHPILAILTVPATSCLVHAIVSNLNTGLRCLPNFLWVALSYHASGSVMVPGLIHSMWYITDAKLCFALKTLKRDWDVNERNELGTPPWDVTCAIGLTLILLFYVPLNVLVTYVPGLKSTAATGPVWFDNTQQEVEEDNSSGSSGSGNNSDSTVCEDVDGFIHIFIIISVSAMLLIGVTIWIPIRAGMELLAEAGELTTNGSRRCALAVAEAEMSQRDVIRRILDVVVRPDVDRGKEDGGKVLMEEGREEGGASDVGSRLRQPSLSLFSYGSSRQQQKAREEDVEEERPWFVPLREEV